MPDKPADTSPLTFHWSDPARKVRGLGFWMLIVILGLAVFFYLFQVVYPQAQRFTPVPQHIVALNPADPVARQIMNKVQDLDFLILPPSAEVSGNVKLEDHSPVFHPTFEGHSLQLQDLPHKAFTEPPARLLQMDVPVLPPLDLSELRPVSSPARPGAKELHLKMQLSGALASRAVIRGPGLSAITLSDPAGCRFQLGVGTDGGVEFALPIASSEGKEVVEKLTAILLKVRFAPADSGGARTAGPTWGVASFEWSNGTAHTR